MDTIITFMNATGKSFVGFSSSMLIQSSLLIIILLILNAVLRKKVRLVFLYGIWMLVLVKLVLPTTFSSPIGLGYLFGDKVPDIIAETDYIPEKIDSILDKFKSGNRSIASEAEIPIRLLNDISLEYNTEISPEYYTNIPSEYNADILPEYPVNVPPESEFTLEATPATASLSWQGFVFLFWLAIVIAMVLYLIRRMLIIRNLLSQSKRPDDSILDIFEQCRNQIGVKRPVMLELSPIAISPSVCGLFRPKILIPQDLPIKLKTEDLRPIFLHELAHIKRDDLGISLIQTVLQIVYFYNPLLWVANVTIRKVREQAVDEAVLVAMGEKAEDYPETLLNISRMTFGRPNLSLRLIGIVESKKALERRIMIMLNKPVPKSSKLGHLGLIAIVVIGSIILPMGYNPIERSAYAASMEESNEGGIIVPGERVGEYTIGMNKDEVLRKLGEPEAICLDEDEGEVVRRGQEKYDLNNRECLMIYSDISFGIEDDSVEVILVRSPLYKLRNGLIVGNSEQKVKQAFGKEFKLEEALGKVFRCYHAKGLAFEIHKNTQTVAQIVVYKPEGNRGDPDVPDIQERLKYIIIPGARVGDYTFNMSRNDVLASLGNPKFIFYGNNRYTLENLPENYYMSYGDISFRIGDDSVREITVLSPAYKFPNGLKVGDSEQKVKKIFGEDFNIREFEKKDFLSYEDENLMFEIHKQDRTVMEINVTPSPASGHYRKADIPATTYINEKGRLVDKIDYPFVNDPKVVGGWKTVDFVREIKDFDPLERNWGGKLWLNHIIFEKGGTMPRSDCTWTKGLVLSDDTASKYILKEIDGSSYMFYEWKSGDYTIRYMKPFYYVLKKVSLEEVKYEPKYGPKADIPETSHINKEGHIVDKIDWPFVNDPRLIGTWESVDFIGEIEQFDPDEKNWDHGELYLKGLIFKPNGKTFKPWWTWTKGLIFHSGDKTASKYTIKNIEGSTYMFYEWKSGDYVIRHRKPSYYVLKKVSSKTSGPLDKKWISKQEDDDDDDDEEDEEFTRRLPARIRKLDIDTADLEEVKEIFGEPIKYVWGEDTFTEDNLPKRYILVYPGNFHIYMRDNMIVELRHEHDFSYVFRNKLRCGSTLNEVFDLVGHPKKVVQGEGNKFKDGVLYKDIDGREGHCYYARHDQDIRLWFLDYKLIAIYMTRSDYGE